MGQMLRRALHASGQFYRVRMARLRWVDPVRHQWTRRAARFFARFAGSGDLVFDVGANVGDRTALFRTLGSRVVAVEPNPACVDRLRRTFAGDPNVWVVPEAAGAAAGDGTLRVGAFNPLSSMSADWVDGVRSSGRFGAEAWAGEVPVRVTTLEALVARFGRPRFCKVDVEGFEHEALKGLSSPPDAASFEWTPEVPGPALGSVERLATVGLRWFNFAPEDSLAFELPRWVGPDEAARRLADRAGAAERWGDVYAARREPPPERPDAH